MPPSASCASNDTRQGILGNGDIGHTSVRKHDITKTPSTHKKCGLIYEIIAKKKKKQTQKSTEKRKKRLNTIRKYLLQTESPDESTTEDETDDSTTGSVQTTTA